MSDILKRLQACAIAGCSPPERALALEAANEIARLREERRSITTLFGKVESLEADNARLREERLSNEERGAIRWATAALLYDADKTWPAFRERSKHSREAAETMKRLLDRHPLPPGPEANG